MADGRGVLDRSRAMMEAAERLDPIAPGAAGLAYQAANLAIKELLTQTDGAVAWEYGAREQRAGSLLGIDPADLAFLHHVRQKDFYADTGFGGEEALPSPDESRRAVSLARRVVDAVASRLKV